MAMSCRRRSTTTCRSKVSCNHMDTFTYIAWIMIIPTIRIHHSYPMSPNMNHQHTLITGIVGGWERTAMRPDLVNWHALSYLIDNET